MSKSWPGIGVFLACRARGKATEVDLIEVLRVIKRGRLGRERPGFLHEGVESAAQDSAVAGGRLVSDKGLSGGCGSSG